MIEKKQHYNNLLDAYGCLLTEHQVEICRLYYEDDLSLQEIAENYQISRNAVFDNIKRVETLLEDYEIKLGLVEKESKEANKKILISIKVPLSEKEIIIKNINKKSEIFESSENVFVNLITTISQRDKLLDRILKNINCYEIKISKIEKELKSR